MEEIMSPVIIAVLIACAILYFFLFLFAYKWKKNVFKEEARQEYKLAVKSPNADEFKKHLRKMRDALDLGDLTPEEAGISEKTIKERKKFFLEAHA
jgi:hypothetical protein